MVEASTVRRIKQLMTAICGSTVLVEYTNLKPLQKHAAQRGFPTLNAYLDAVEKDPVGEKDAFLDHGLIHSTRYGRDPKFWASVDSTVFSAAGGTFDVLCLGCSKGAEIATIAALVRQRFEPENFAVTAIDVSPAMVAAARNVRIEPRAVSKLNLGLKKPVFDRTKGKMVTLLPEVHARIRVEVGNVLDASGFWWSCGGYDLVLCRNLLLYLRETDLPEVFERIARALKPGGFFGIGSVDPRPPARLFKPVAPMLYRGELKSALTPL